MSIGSRIKERREELGLKQSELAKLVGVSSGSIGNYECGVSAPNEKILFKLFEALNCDANYLYQDDIDERILNNQEFPVDKHEKRIITIYRTLDDYGKKAVDSILDVEYERVTVSKQIKIAARNGSYEERTITGSEENEIEKRLNDLADVPE